MKKKKCLLSSSIKRFYECYIFKEWRENMISDYDLGEIVEDLLPEPSNFFILRYSNGYILHCHVGKCRKLYKIDPITGEKILIEVEGEDTFSIPLSELK